MYWATKPLKRAHTSQGTHGHGAGTLSIMLRPDGSRVYALPEEVPEWNPEEPTPESTEEMTEFYESDPEEDEDYSPAPSEVCRAELAVITAKVLTPRQHEAFYLAHVDGLPTAEVARRMHITYDTARKTIQDARHKVEAATGVDNLPNRNRGWGVAA